MTDPKCARVLLEAAERDVLTLQSMTDLAPESPLGSTFSKPRKRR